MVAGSPVTNPWCLHLGCNYKQCVQKVMKCNQDNGSPDDSWKINGQGLPTEEIFCVAAKLHSDMDPAKFAALLLAILMSVGMCAAGVASAGNSSRVREFKNVPPNHNP
mmetsp:Transcript_81417/g.230714  ORF Transcript_81417/g.230714 Transcript_81417/m.230714 type:complete len:108 (-) Transcript_81417:70-393(-)